MHHFEHPWVYEHMEHVRGDEFGGGTSMLLSTLSTVFWVALFIGLTWALLRWVFPYILPMIEDIFARPTAEPSALEILRRRYAAGEIDAVMFEHMRERLEASYQQESNEMFHNDNSYLREHRTDYNAFSSPASYDQESVRRADQKRSR